MIGRMSRFVLLVALIVLAVPQAVFATQEATPVTNGDSEVVPGNPVEPDVTAEATETPPASFTIADLSVTCEGLVTFTASNLTDAPIDVTVALYATDPASEGVMPIQVDGQSLEAAISVNTASNGQIHHDFAIARSSTPLYAKARWTADALAGGHQSVVLLDCAPAMTATEKAVLVVGEVDSGTPIRNTGTPFASSGSSLASPEGDQASPVFSGDALPPIGKTPSPLPLNVWRLPFEGSKLVTQLSGKNGSVCASHYENPKDSDWARARNARAIDFSLSYETPVLAVGPGTVVAIPKITSDKDKNFKGGEIYVEIDHGGGVHSFYDHLSSIRSDIVPGKTVVKAGELIGYSGSSGANSPHLHLALVQVTSGQRDEPIDERALLGDSVPLSFWDDEGFAVECNRIGNDSQGHPVPAIWVTGPPTDWSPTPTFTPTVTLTPTPTVTPTPTLTEYRKTSEVTGLPATSGYTVLKDGRFFLIGNAGIDQSIIHVYGADGKLLDDILIPKDQLIVSMTLGENGNIYAVVYYLHENTRGVVIYDSQFHQVGTIYPVGFYFLSGNIAVDANGNVYVQDTYASGGCNCIRRFASDGVVHDFLSGDEALGGEYTVGPDGYVYFWRGDIISKYSSSGEKVASWPAPSFGQTGTNAIVTDDDGNVYAVDSVRVVKYSSKGTILARWDIPYEEGMSPYELFEAHVDSAGNVYLHGNQNRRVLVFAPAVSQKLTLNLTVRCHGGGLVCGDANHWLDGFSAVWTLQWKSVTGTSSESVAVVAVGDPGLIEARAVIVNGLARVDTDALPIGDYQVCLHANLEGPHGGTVRIADADICQDVHLEGSSGAPAALSVPFDVQAPEVSPSPTPEPSTPPETAVATETPAIVEPTQTTIWSETVTASPTTTELPPSITAIATETAIQTATTTPIVTATALAETGSLFVTIQTSDGSDLPDGLSVCVDRECQSIAPVGLNGTTHGFRAALVPSGVQVTFDDLILGEHVVTLRDGRNHVIDQQQVTIADGETTQAFFILREDATATPTVAGTIVVTSPTAASTGTIPAPTVTVTVTTGSATKTPTGTVAPASLPNTGTGGGGSSLPIAIMLTVAAMIMGGMGLRVRRR